MMWPEITVIEDEARHSALVFGMRWSAVIGTQPRTLAARRASVAGASHYLWCGQRVPSVGLARLARHKGWTYWSAAALFAARFPHETIGAILRIGQGQHWLVASRNAAVLSRSDCLYDTHDDAHAALMRLASDIPGMRLIVDDVDVSLADLTASPAASARLHVVAWFRRLPRWVAMSGIGLLTVFCGSIALMQASRPRDDAAGHDKGLDAPAMAAAWEAAQRSALTQTWQGADAYMPVLEHMLGVPIALMGWALRDIECTWQHPVWRCAAVYQRQTVLANNETFAQGYEKVTGRPADIVFTPLSEARVHWPIQGAPAPASAAGLMEAGIVAREFASRLQSLEGAFSRMHLGPPERLHVVPPLDPESGRPLPRPPHFPPLSRYPLEIEGPFRSFAVLTGVDDVAWTSVRVAWTPATPIAIEQSPLNVTLKGEVRAFHTAGAFTDNLKDDL